MQLVSVTPVARTWPYAVTSLTRDIRIIDKPTFNEENWSFWNLRRTEAEAVRDRTHWLCVERECDRVDRALMPKMAEDLRDAMLGLQLWAPIGWDGLILNCSRREENGALTVERAQLPEAFAAPRWGQMLDLRMFDPAQLGTLVEGALVAAESRCAPVMNPFQFLELGFQMAMNHDRAGAVLWMMGLDGLLAAEKKEVFSRRLKKLLGEGTCILPTDCVGRQLGYTVGGVAADMFDFRNVIAHGKEIPQKYREPIMPSSQPGMVPYSAAEEWSYGTLIIDCIAFALIAALRRVITEDLMPRIKDQRNWKRWLDNPN
jgi:hypothetical protein